MREIIAHSVKKLEIIRKFVRSFFYFFQDYFSVEMYSFILYFLLSELFIFKLKVYFMNDGEDSWSFRYVDKYDRIIDRAYQKYMYICICIITILFQQN